METVYDAPIVPAKVSGVTPVVTVFPFEVTVIGTPAMGAPVETDDCMVMDAVVDTTGPKVAVTVVLPGTVTVCEALVPPSSQCLKTKLP